MEFFYVRDIEQPIRYYVIGGFLPHSSASGTPGTGQFWDRS
jgi:hypothetical protein